MKQLICPISDQRVNEQVTRINAFLSILLVISGFVFSSVFFFVFLLADFYIRAFTKLKFSPLSYVSYYAANALKLNKKNIDKAPKIFAARLGFIFTSLVILFTVLHFHTAAFIIAGVLVFFATLEFALAVCVGCLLYTYFVVPFYK